MNVIMNAGEAIKGNGKITIRTSHDDKEVKVEISDTGEGGINVKSKKAEGTDFIINLPVNK